MLSQENVVLHFEFPDANGTESEDKLKSLLMKVKEESEKPSLNSTFKKLRSQYLELITSWQIEGGEKWKQ